MGIVVWRTTVSLFAINELVPHGIRRKLPVPWDRPSLDSTSPDTTTTRENLHTSGSALVAYFKLTDDPGSISLFTGLGMEPSGSYVVGFLEARGSCSHAISTCGLSAPRLQMSAVSSASTSLHLI